MNVQVKIWDAAWRLPITRKWGSILYVHRHKGFPLRDCIAMWASAERGLVRNNTELWGETTVTENFFTLAAERQYAEATNYYCVEGCCTVQWSNGRNIGGYGRAGCPCDNMAEPRDLARGPIS